MFRPLIGFIAAITLLPTTSLAEKTGFRDIRYVGCHLTNDICYVRLDGDKFGPADCSQPQLRWSAGTPHGERWLNILNEAAAAGRQVSFNVANNCFDRQSQYPTFTYGFVAGPVSANDSAQVLRQVHGKISHLYAMSSDQPWDDAMYLEDLTSLDDCTVSSDTGLVVLRLRPGKGTDRLFTVANIALSTGKPVKVYVDTADKDAWGACYVDIIRMNP